MAMGWMRAAVVLAAALGVCASAHAEEVARYRVEARVAWTAEAHPVDFPANAHWSRLIAVAHGPRYALFADGDTASSGLALLATNGRVAVLEAELAEARRRRRVGAHVVVGGLKAGVGVFTFEIDANANAPLLSFATMLAPSPDWFAGAASVALRGPDGWLTTFETPLFVWDAGADGGETFAARNRPTQPRQSVRLVVHPAFLRPGGLPPIGRATITRID